MTSSYANNHCASFSTLLLLFSLHYLLLSLSHFPTQIIHTILKQVICRAAVFWYRDHNCAKSYYTFRNQFRVALNLILTLGSAKSKLQFTFSSVPSDMPEPQCETLFSEMSAFTRIAAVTPKKNVNAVEFKPKEDEQSSLAKLLAGLDGTVTELISNVQLVRQRKDAQLEELRNTM